MVRYEPEDDSYPENLYPISFRARMHHEGFVRLGTPVVLTVSLLSAWQGVVPSLRRRELADWGCRPENTGHGRPWFSHSTSLFGY